MSGGRKALAKQWRDFVGLRIAAEHRFREDELAVQVNVEDAVSPGDHLDDTDYVFPLLEDARHQTGGVGKRPSGDAVLDPNVMTLLQCRRNLHPPMPPRSTAATPPP